MQEYLNKDASDRMMKQVERTKATAPGLHETRMSIGEGIISNAAERLDSLTEGSLYKLKTALGPVDWCDLKTLDEN